MSLWRLQETLTFTRDFLSQFSLVSRSNVFFLGHLLTECLLFPWHFLRPFVVQKLSVFFPLRLSAFQVPEAIVGIPQAAAESVYHPAAPLRTSSELAAPQGRGDFT